MNTYARIEGTSVVELFKSSVIDPSLPENSQGLVWIKIDSNGVMPEQGWNWNGVEFTSPPVDSPTITSAISALNVLLPLKEAAGVQFNGVTFATGTSDQLKLLAAYIMANNNLWADDEGYLAADGTLVLMTSSDIIKLALGVMAYIKACTSNYSALLAQIQSNPTANITEGWPSQNVEGDS